MSANEQTPFLCDNTLSREETDSTITMNLRNQTKTRAKLFMLAVVAIAAALVILGSSSTGGDFGAVSKIHQTSSSSSTVDITTETTNDTNANMNFGEFLQTFGKHYESQDEYAFRQNIYESNVQSISEHNENAKHHGWTMGINQFADLLPHEMNMGFDKGSPHGPNAHEFFETTSSSSAIHHLFSSIMGGGEEFNSNKRQLRHLPKTVDWRTHDPPVTTPVKNQGHCGSCWAFAATSVLESHTALATDKLFVLSPQELVSCAPNPNECGGHGGCSGATGELAYEYVAKHGMVTEWAYGYSSFGGKTGTCLLHESKYDDYLPNAKVSVVGYSSLPTNSYDSLLYAVAMLGPVVISVAANTWPHYKSGVFDDFEITEHYDINHAVVLEGYGTDEETGQDYWLVRNSWGPIWGEDGYIRLKRTDPLRELGYDSYETNHCKLDITPADGVACVGPDGNATLPEQIVCGTSGILYANVVPVGAHLL
jgi:cathepsin L